jgi:threonine synthase
MDIQVSSNFERYLFEASGRDAGTVRKMMASQKQSGTFDLGPIAKTLQSQFSAAAASEAEVLTATRHTLDHAGYLLDPHTACAVVAADKLKLPAHIPTIILATAHPAKFPHTLTGAWPTLPPRLHRLMTDQERITQLPNDVSTIEAYVLAHARQGGGGTA